MNAPPPPTKRRVDSDVGGHDSTCRSHGRTIKALGGERLQLYSTCTRRLRRVYCTWQQDQSRIEILTGGDDRRRLSSSGGWRNERSVSPCQIKTELP